MATSTVFLTHRTPERELALAIKQAVETAFPGVDVFLSSDPEDVGAGDPWVEAVSNTLKSCDIQIILASPAALERPWIHFEAGAGWRRVHQIPLCHSGQEPGQLPIPLSLLTAGKVTDPSFLESIVKKIAEIAENRLPSVDYGALAAQLGEIEVRYAREAEPEREPEVSVVPRTVGPELRDLSDSRQKLEARLYAVILRWNTLRAKGVTGDPHLTVRAIETANAFWADPTSLVLDNEVTDAVATIEASISDLQARTGVPAPLRTRLLKALREMSYRQDKTSEILRFDVLGFAQDAAASPQQVSRRLRDLLDEGLVEPHYQTLGESAMQGAVRITAAGRAELQRLGEDED